MKRSLSGRIGIAVAFSVVILFNYLANAVPLGGQTTGAISDLYDSLFTPAGFTFAIWGIIYLALLGFVIRQFLDKPHEVPALSAIRTLFVVNSAANALWIVAWHYDYLWASMGIMIVILWTLVKINSVIFADTSLKKGWSYFCVALPFSIYFGWISVATIANVSVLQSAFGLNDFLLSQEIWTALKLIIAGGAGYAWGWRYKQPAYLLVIAWAAYGISVANVDHKEIQLAAQVLSVASVIGALFAWKSRKHHAA